MPKMSGSLLQLFNRNNYNRHLYLKILCLQYWSLTRVAGECGESCQGCLCAGFSGFSCNWLPVLIQQVCGASQVHLIGPLVVEYACLPASVNHQ